VVVVRDIKELSTGRPFCQKRSTGNITFLLSRGESCRSLRTYFYRSEQNVPAKVTTVDVTFFHYICMAGSLLPSKFEMKVEQIALFVSIEQQRINYVKSMFCYYVYITAMAFRAAHVQS
jgi:hypothetical protein